MNPNARWPNCSRATNWLEMKTHARPLTPRQGLRLARAELKRLRSRLEDLSDYVDLLEARRRDSGKTTFSTEEVLRRLHLRRLHSLSQ